MNRLARQRDAQITQLEDRLFDWRRLRASPVGGDGEHRRRNQRHRGPRRWGLRRT